MATRHDLETELLVFISFLAEALERGLQNAAMILSEQVAARRHAITRQSHVNSTSKSTGGSARSSKDASERVSSEATASGSTYKRGVKL